MLIFPAIDLQDGRVVRLVQGRLNKKIYSANPLKTAKHWIKNGAEWLHVVDLDGAITGVQKNLEIVKEIAKNVSVPIQFGGGVRDIKTIEALLKSGIKRVVLGTRAVSDETFLKKAFKKFSNRIIVSIDSKGGMVSVQGWRSLSKKTDCQAFALHLRKMGFKEFIYTDTLKDGTLSGPNIKEIKSLLKNTGLKIIASGGISSLQDIYKLKKLEKDGLSGVVIGKALYEGKFTLSQALKSS